MHYGGGAVTVYDDTVHLESDFEVGGPGPKFHVYLVPSPDIASASQVKGTMFVDLGRLHAFKGSQNYGVPAGVNLSNYGSVVIWCEQFGV
ncbi:MAG: DM13 domain-containing protein [Gammaproteobacteria bacterium]|nr:DM13 domain-containing protein [Gammaproteobacteria bacterium]